MTDNSSLLELIGSPLYQVNLVLWMATKNNGDRVVPVLAAAGLDVLYVERSLNLPPDLLQKLATLGLAITDPVSPDFILTGPDKSYVLLECKRSMFGVASSTAEQCRALLLHVPRVIEQALVRKGGSFSSGALVYLTRANDEHDILDGVLGVARELETHKMKILAAGALTLSVAESSVRVAPHPSGRLPKSLASQLRGPVDVQRVAEGTDPRPLYVIPWLPDTESQSDAYSRRVFAERVKLSAAQIVDRSRIGSDVEILLDDVLALLTLGFSKKLSVIPLRKLRREAKMILEKRFQVLKNVALLPLPDGAGWGVTIHEDATKDEILAALRDTNEPDPQFSLSFDASDG